MNVTVASGVASFLEMFAAIDTVILALYVWPPNEKPGRRTQALLIVAALVIVAGISLLSSKGG